MLCCLRMLGSWHTSHYHVGLQGPREDTGFMSGVNPGVRMAERIYNFCKKYHPKTNVMVSGVRKPAGLYDKT